jgi:BirA family biotin operon repressor/biotin-[acetyl-CoA-carboxylase] ligase
MPDDFTQWTLPTKHLGKCIQVHDSLDSTNSLALSYGNDPARHGHVILAREQTAGRGQYGRSWHAPPGSSVLMSVLLYPPPELRRPALLTAWAAVSVCETIRTLTNLQPIIKWPNDVLVAGKKVCGILIEQRTTGNADFPLASIVGIGLNVSQPADLFVQAGLPLAGSLWSLSGRALAFDDVARELIRLLDRLYDQLLADDCADLERMWTSSLGLLGKAVIVEGIQERHEGRLLEVTFEGLVLDVDGDPLRLTPESIRQIKEPRTG